MGVENELFVAFQRFARYPGVDEKDLNTLETENELTSIPEIPEGSCFDVGVGSVIEEGMLSATFSGRVFEISTGFSTYSRFDTSNNSCDSATSVSCVLSKLSSGEHAVASSTLWLLLKVGADTGSEDRAAIPPIPNAAISCGKRGRDFLWNSGELVGSDQECFKGNSPVGSVVDFGTISAFVSQWLHINRRVSKHYELCSSPITNLYLLLIQLLKLCYYFRTRCLVRFGVQFVLGFESRLIFGTGSGNALAMLSNPLGGSIGWESPRSSRIC